MDEDEKNFKYLLAEQKEFCLISFIGTLDQHCLPEIEECQHKVKQSDCKYFIFNFRDVDAIEKSVYRPLVQLQHIIRKEKKQVLRICGVHPGWKATLIEDGIIRNDETLDNIRTALTELGKI